MNPKRALMALLLANILIQTGGSLKERQMPRPARYVAIALVFMILGVVSDTLPRFSKTAVAFAGLFTLTVAMRMVAGKPYGVATTTPDTTIEEAMVAGYWQSPSAAVRDYVTGTTGNQRGAGRPAGGRAAVGSGGGQPKQPV